MIQQALRNMIALMLAKFVLNDVPHAAGFNPPTATRPLAPAYFMPEGVYDWVKLTAKTPKSAYHASMYAHVIGLKPLGEYSWRYMQIPVGWINDWVSVFHKYVGYEPEEARLKAEEGEFPISDFYNLSNEADYWPRGFEYLPGSEAEVDRRGAFGYCLRSNIEWAHRLKREMESMGTYYPPILKSDYKVIDGAHRAAMLWGMYGPDYKIWVWRMVG